MHAFNDYVFANQLKLPTANTLEKFQLQNPWTVDHKIRLVKPKFAVGDRVLLRVKTIPHKHNAGYLLEDGIGTVKHVMVLPNGVAECVFTRALYLVEFDEAIGWIDVDSDWKTMKVVVQESNLMERVK